MNELIYLYGFVDAQTSPPPRALGGVHGTAVEMIASNDVAAVVSRVPADEFDGGVISARLEDLNWVGARGLEHERVVAWYVDHADIVPVALFTMYSTSDALTADMDARRAGIRRAMERLRAHREWDLKISYDQGRFAEHAGALLQSVKDLDTEIATASEGKRYLLGKKRADLIRREMGTAARAAAQNVMNDLAEYAAEHVALPIPRAEALPVVFNAALLVERAKEPALRERAENLANTLHHTGITIQLTGPWAPYRFTEQA